MQWEDRGGICQIELRTCGFAAGPQDNWGFTQYISYGDAIELLLHFNYRFTPCSANPACFNPFVTIYIFNTDSQVSDAVRTSIGNYVPLNGNELESRIQQVGGTAEEKLFRYTGMRKADGTNYNGFYLGFRDQGTCGQINRVRVYHRIAPGYSQGLLTCPDIALPIEGTTDTNTGPCSCATNAAGSTSLDLTCSADGTCTGNPSCGCVPGYQLNVNGSSVPMCQREF